MKRLSHNMIYHPVWYCWMTKTKAVKPIFFPRVFFLEKTIVWLALLTFSSLFFVHYPTAKPFSLLILLIKLILKELQIVSQFVEERLIVYFKPPRQYIVIVIISDFHETSSSVTFTLCVNRFLLINTFSFLFLQTSTYQLDVSVFWPVSALYSLESSASRSATFNFVSDFLFFLILF